MTKYTKSILISTNIIPMNRVKKRKNGINDRLINIMIAIFNPTVFLSVLSNDINIGIKTTENTDHHSNIPCGSV